VTFDPSRRYVLLLLLLGASWGSSYLFIRVGVRDLSPATLTEGRFLVAAPALLVFAWRRYRGAALVRAWRQGIVLGALMAGQLMLVAWGEKYIDSGTAAVANASVPIFVALLAFFFVPSERLSGPRLIGVLLGLIGVAVLAGVHPSGGLAATAGTGAVVLASLGNAAGNLYAGLRMATGGPVLVAASTVVALLLLAPFAFTSLPASMPGWKPVGAVLALGLIGAAFAQILTFRVIRLYGSARAALISYLVPAFALLYGAVLLGEKFTPQKLAGLVLITGGVALGSGFARLSREAPAASTCARDPLSPDRLSRACPGAGGKSRL
jgi:drug/metabolite transporter (DMT)-like permease